MIASFQIHIDIPRMNPLIPIFQQKVVQEVSTERHPSAVPRFACVLAMCCCQCFVAVFQCSVPQLVFVLLGSKRSSI